MTSELRAGIDTSVPGYMRSLDEARRIVWQEIDHGYSEIVKIEANITRLKQHLNSLIPVGSLPAELIEKIFRHLMCNHDRTRSTAVDCTFRYCHASLQAVTQVCHIWRQIAMSSPRLWTCIPTDRGVACMEEMCRRAAHLPISVHIDFTDPHQSDACKMAQSIFEQLHRLKDVSIDGWTERIQESLSKYSTRTAPQLRSLSITCTPFKSSGFCTLILSERCPCLGVLTMKGLSMGNIRPSNLPALRELYLGKLPARSTIDDMLSVIEALPTLRRLSLSQDYPDAAGLEAHISHKIVSLPNLRFLKLTSFCIWLLNYLILLPTVRLDISIPDVSEVLAQPAESTYERCVEITRTLLKSHFALARSHLAHGDDSRVTPDALACAILPVRGCNRYSITVAGYASASRNVRIALHHGPLDQQIASEVMTSLCAALPLLGVRSLWLQLDDAAPAKWREILEIFPSAELLQIYGHISPLRAVTALCDRGSASEAALPSLKKITVIRAAYTRHILHIKELLASRAAFGEAQAISFTEQVGQAPEFEELEIGPNPHERDVRLKLFMDRLSRETEPRRTI